MVQKLEPKWASRDEVVGKEWADDELCHDTGTLEGLAGMLERGDELDKDLVVVNDGEGEGGVTRVWVGHGSGDRVTSFEASKRWFGRLNVKDKEFKEYDGWFHKCECCVDMLAHINESANLLQYMRSQGRIKLPSPMMLPTGSLPGQVRRNFRMRQRPRASCEDLR